MAIHELFSEEKIEHFSDSIKNAKEGAKGGKTSLFSTLLTRFFFLLLLVADLAWLAYTLLALPVITILHLAFKKPVLFKKTLLNLRRSSACGLSLFVGLFSPPFGIMVACTYFLMYDKRGMEEVVPAPLQAQFKEIFTTE